MSRRRQLSDEERALWSGFARSIKPLRKSPKSPAAAAAKAKPAAAAAKADPAPAPAPVRVRAAAPPAKPATKTPPLAPLGRRLKQRVARGHDPIQARLDLHGYTQREAHTALLNFLQGAQADGARMALIVTGKGGGRGGQDGASERGVLRRQVPMWLSLPEFRPFVVGFEDAHIGHGGEGALYVRLRRPR